jgi:hypothetical protein
VATSGYLASVEAQSGEPGLVQGEFAGDAPTRAGVDCACGIGAVVAAAHVPLFEVDRLDCGSCGRHCMTVWYWTWVSLPVPITGRVT